LSITKLFSKFENIFQNIQFIKYNKQGGVGIFIVILIRKSSRITTFTVVQEKTK